MQPVSIIQFLTFVSRDGMLNLMADVNFLEQDRAGRAINSDNIVHLHNAST